MLSTTVSLQDLLEKRMGMHLDEMRHLSQLSPEAREGQSLTGAHLPARGFYKIKSSGKVQKPAVQEISCCGFPVWWQMQASGHDSSTTDLRHVSIESEVAAGASADKPVMT